jgi:hypothetical protein
MQASVIGQIQSLQRMSVADLLREWEHLYGEPARSRNRDYLWRRLAWRVQELAYGGLSEAAKAKIVEFASTSFPRARVATDLASVATTAPAAAPPKTHRDPRLPSPGTVITRQFHGREIRVVALEDGFEWDGREFDSLTAVAKSVTGQHWNGRLFFGVTERKRRK